MKFMTNSLAAFALSAGMGMADSSSKNDEVVNTTITVPEMSGPLYASQECIVEAIEKATGKKPNGTDMRDGISILFLSDYYTDGGTRSVQVESKSNNVQSLLTLSTSVYDIVVSEDIRASRFFSAASIYYLESNGEVTNGIKGTPDRETALDLLKKVDANIRTCAPAIS